MFILVLGTDILNGAIMALYNKIPPEKWKFVNVGIAPSTITITEHVCIVF